MRNDLSIERPDSDFPGYHDAMEWEEWDDEGRYLREEAEDNDD